MLLLVLFLLGICAGGFRHLFNNLHNKWMLIRLKVIYPLWIGEPPPPQKQQQQQRSIHCTEWLISTKRHLCVETCMGWLCGSLTQRNSQFESVWFSYTSLVHPTNHSYIHLHHTYSFFFWLPSTVTIDDRMLYGVEVPLYRHICCLWRL